MELFKLIDNILVSLPVTGVLANGQSVTAYHKLPRETLIAEGWKPKVIDAPPEMREGYVNTLYFEDTGTEIRGKWRQDAIIGEEQ